MTRTIQLGSRLAIVCLLVASFSLVAPFSSVAGDEPPNIPEPLKPWVDWVKWDEEHHDCPTIYSVPDQPICFWPSRLELSVTDDGGTWSVDLHVFEETWVPLPGSSGIWPVNVRAGDQPIVVVSRGGQPAVKLPAGREKLTGDFRWNRMPQKIAIPNQVGIVALSVNDKPVPIVSRDNGGEIWLRRTRSEQADKDFLNAQVYRVIEDGIPVWLHTDIELTVAGKSREEELGWSLPADWHLSTIESQIPVAVDDRGFVKAQVRAGKWTISIHAFRTDDPVIIQYAADAQPIAQIELIGLKADPEHRISLLEDVSMVDAAQTTFPDKWRGAAVYQWDTKQSFRLVEKMRGMGEQSPEGLAINRRFWLDEDGGGLTYQDSFRGQMQQIWRLDVADGHKLGAVRVAGQGQLITTNPTTGASGVEIRSRDLNFSAIGRVKRTPELSAIGWQTNADSLRWQLTLPPGWRVLAIFGADQVEGDWLTAWSLLDLFLLLIFAFAVFRLFGFTAGVLALLAFGLAYHEPGAPRLTWLFMLMPIALLRVVGSGALKSWISAWRFAAVGLLLLCFIPFVAQQIQSAIYPQLDTPGVSYGGRGIFALPGDSFRYRADASWSSIYKQQARAKATASVRRSKFDVSNLAYDPKAKIQTGPAQPEWDWNNVSCVWNGPVTADQTVTPILISGNQHRILTVIRMVLLMLLAWVLLGAGKLRIPFFTRKPVANVGAKAAAGCVALACLLIPCQATAQMPDKDMLETLRQRLQQVPDAFPNAAEIPTVELKITDNQIEMTAEIHAVLDVAVPLPGRLPTWSPVSVTLDDDPNVLLSGRDRFLWILVPKGIHKVTMKGLLSAESDWEWTFILKPRYVAIDAKNWNVTGVNASGVPEDQVFFAREKNLTDDQAAYDRTAFDAIVVVDRQLEIGLVSRVRTTVTRLSQAGKAVSLQIPLLSGESVLSANREIADGRIAVRMGANQKSVSWESELSLADKLELLAEDTDESVERWQLITSPIWNVSFDGLQPIFESNEKDLIPVWHPWRGESVQLGFSQPTPVTGDMTTIQSVTHENVLGSRRRNNTLTMELDCSLASDLLITLDDDVEISSLSRNKQSMPVQRNGPNVIVPTKPGKQTIEMQWRKLAPISSVVEAGTIALPVEVSNVTTIMTMPENRWVLWADGPLRGPAVRFWTILAVAILAAIALGSLPHSPLRRIEWILLVIGLTQVHLVAAIFVVGWLFLLAWRGRHGETKSGNLGFNLLQIGIILLTFASLATLMVVVGQGLLGNPEMFISGNSSSHTYLRWFQPRVGGELPNPYVVSISVWFYRLLMLFWALWLATALLRWLTWGWHQFSAGGFWRGAPKKPKSLPPNQPPLTSNPSV